MQRVEQQGAKIRGRPAERSTKIRASDITNEQGVACQDRLWRALAPIEIEDDNRNRFWGVARCFERFQSHPPELDHAPVAERRKSVFGPRFGAKINRCAQAIPELQVSGYKVGVQMGQDHVLDLKVMFGCKYEILVDIALGVDNDCCARYLVSNKVGSVCEARQVELLEDQVAPLSIADCYLGWGTIRR